MALDRFDGRLTVKTRDEVRDEWRRDYKFRQPDADISQDSTVWLDASTAADASMPLYANVRMIAMSIDLDNATNDQLDKIGGEEIGERRGATASQGYVTVVASSGGGQILAGTVLKHRTTRERYQVLVTDVYTAAIPVPVESLTTGTATTLDAGAILEFENPPIGIGALATVGEDGLTGGGPAEDDDTYRERIRDARRFPAAAANWAHYVRAVEEVPGISIEKAWAYPAIRGPGTMGVVFTMRPVRPGASRIPNGAQVGAVEAAVMASMPGDDGGLFGTLFAQAVDVSIGVTWAPDAPGWVDAAPWPPAASPLVKVDDGGGTATASSFVLSPLSSVVDPTVGKTIAFFDQDTKRFVAKRITAVSGSVGGPWTITTSTEAGSDASYIPQHLQRVMPWSTSLPDLVAPLLAYFDRQGPGEQVAILPDPGGRKRRAPESPAQWSSVITSRMTDGVDDLDVVLSVSTAEPSIPMVTTTGSPGAWSYLHTLADFGVYPESA